MPGMPGGYPAMPGGGMTVGGGPAAMMMGGGDDGDDDDDGADDGTYDNDDGDGGGGWGAGQRLGAEQTTPAAVPSPVAVASPAATRGLRPSEIARFPAISFRAPPAAVQPRPTCRKCNGVLGDGDSVILLPCTESFHSGCLLPHFDTCSACPSCGLSLIDE